jgi:hypothetical protein
MLCTTVLSRSVGRVVPLALALALALVSCRAEPYRRANSPLLPSQTTVTGATVDVGPSPGAPSGIEPNAGSTGTTSASPASPMEGACADGEPRGGTTDRISCLESCRGYDDMVPLGSRCISQYADCSLKCEEKFSRP